MADRFGAIEKSPGRETEGARGGSLKERSCTGCEGGEKGTIDNGCSGTRGTGIHPSKGSFGGDDHQPKADGAYESPYRRLFVTSPPCFLWPADARTPTAELLGGATAVVRFWEPVLLRGEVPAGELRHSGTLFRLRGKPGSAGLPLEMSPPTGPQARGCCPWRQSGGKQCDRVNRFC